MTDLIEYWLIQFVADPIRQERRNIGVVVFGRGEAEFVGIGADSKVDIERFRPLAGEAGGDLWVYGEWIGWFTDLCRERGQGILAFRTRLDALETKGLPFVARHGGEIEPRPGETIKKLAQNLYEELVDEPLSGEMTAFEQRVRDIVTASGLRYMSAFEEQVEVEFPAQREFPDQTLPFDYLLDAPPRVALRCLPMHENRDDFAREVEQVVAAFRTVAALEFVAKTRCVVLAEPFLEERTAFRDQLDQVARVLDVNSPLAARKLREIIAGR
jgi:hypothetical protein